MTKEEKKAKKLAKKEIKAEKKAVKIEKATAKAQAKADKKHTKAYDKFVKDTEKKNKKAEVNAQKDGKPFIPVVIPTVDEFQSKAEIKAANKFEKAYASYVKKIEKKNAKAEKKCLKKGKPFVPIAIPTKEEFANSTASENKTGKIILTIILILLIWFLIYFMIMYINYEYKAHQVDTTEPPKVAQVYEPYSNPHQITTTPDYSIADAKRFLQQVLEDNWMDLGYSADPSNGSISYNNKIVTVNGADCYMFSAGGKSFAVAIKLSACYYAHNGEYTPVTFNNTDIIFGE